MTTPPKVTAERIARLRLQSQGLVSDERRSPIDVVRHMTAMQAQDLGAALWAVGVRTQGANVDDVSQSLERGEIVRSWPMRGTLHFVAGEDLAWILKLTSERSLKGAAKRHAELGFDERTLGRARDIASEELAGGRRMSRDDFIARLESHGVEMDNQRAYRILWYLAQTTTVCWGPRMGAQQALVLHDEWVTKPRVLEHDEALGEFVRRYFDSHGPATIKDFMWWTKLPSAEAKVGLAVAKLDLVELDYNGVAYWMTTDAYQRMKPDSRAARDSVLALTAFDEHLLGYSDRHHVLAPEHAARIVPGGNGVFLPTVVSGGVVVGTWKRKATKSKITITLHPFGDLSPAERKRLAVSVDSYGSFLGLTAAVAPA